MERITNYISFSQAIQTILQIKQKEIEKKLVS